MINLPQAISKVFNVTFVVLWILFYFLANEDVLPGAGDLFREINKNKV